MNAIELKNVTKIFGDHTVLDNVTLSFPLGETTCLMGPSGSGKTTLLRLIAGLDTPTAGVIEGVPERISFVFQENRLADDFSAVSNLRLVTGRTVPDEVLIAHLSQLGLADCVNRPVRELSGGMKRRVAIARAVLCDADLLLMDEPFKGLDSPLHATVIDYVRRHTAGKTVITVTHNPDDVDKLGGSLLLL